MNYIQTVSKIRQRGQLTVPYQIRKALNWPEDEMVVKVEVSGDGFKVEALPISHPQYLSPRKKLTRKEADKIWEDMKRISKMGKQGVNLTAFLRHDRDTHF